MGKQNKVLLAGAGALLLIAGLLVWWGAGTAVIEADEAGQLGYLPAVFRPENTPTPPPTPEPTPEVTPEPTAEPTPTPKPAPHDGLANGSFELGWTDVDGDKQQPLGWELTWIKPGEPLYDSADLATNSCECLHLMGGPDPDPENPPRPGLPEEQWFGGPDALILDGIWTYKAFRRNAAWGTQMSQTFALPPGAQYRVSAPVQMHDQNPVPAAGYDVESSLWVNGDGAWAQVGAEGMVDREWCKHEQTVIVPADGRVQVDIRFKVKYPSSNDFFMDYVQVLPASSPDPYPDFPRCVPETQPLVTYRAYGE